MNKFLRNKGVPSSLRKKINNYLDYNWEVKKQIKIDEDEVYGLLNEDLKDKIKIYFNGRILHNVQIFEAF